MNNIFKDELLKEWGHLTCVAAYNGYNACYSSSYEYVQDKNTAIKGAIAVGCILNRCGVLLPQPSSYNGYQVEWDGWEFEDLKFEGIVSVKYCRDCGNEDTTSSENCHKCGSLDVSFYEEYRSGK